MIPIQDLQENVYPSLHVLDPEVWDKSPYRSFEGDSELKDRYHSLVDKGPEEVSKVIRESSDADLAEILHPTQKEVDTRQGLALIDHTRQRLIELHEKITRQLRMYQCVRDGAMEEMKRRARVKTVENGGEHLNSFISRFIFGPDVIPIVPYPNMPPSTTNTPKEREWIRARVKSGKTVYVEYLWFDIPDIYKKEVAAALVAAKLIKDDTNHYDYSYYSNTPPAQATQKIARFYYKMGFEPKSTVTAHYHCGWYNSSWKNGWSLSHSRQMKTNELEPVE